MTCSCQDKDNVSSLFLAALDSRSNPSASQDRLNQLVRSDMTGAGRFAAQLLSYGFAAGSPGSLARETALMNAIVSAGRRAGLDASCGLRDWTRVFCNEELTDRLHCSPLALAYAPDNDTRITEADYPSATSIGRMLDGLTLAEQVSNRDKREYSATVVGTTATFAFPLSRDIIIGGWNIDLAMPAYTTSEFNARIRTFNYFTIDDANEGASSMSANRDFKIRAPQTGITRLFIPSLYKSAEAQDSDLGVAVPRVVVNRGVDKLVPPRPATRVEIISPAVPSFSRTSLLLVSPLTTAALRAVVRTAAWIAVESEG